MSGEARSRDLEFKVIVLQNLDLEKRPRVVVVGCFDCRCLSDLVEGFGASDLANSVGCRGLVVHCLLGVEG